MRRFRKLLIPVVAGAVKIRLWGSVRVPPLWAGLHVALEEEVLDDYQG
jgi:hypothetical protein